MQVHIYYDAPVYIQKEPVYTEAMDARSENCNTSRSRIPPGHRVLSWTVILAAPLCAFCGSNPTAPNEAAATVTIGATGVSPKEVQIPAWGRVRFVNNDVRSHTIVSDPVDLHTQCPPVNNVGLLQPGESRESGTLNLPGTCDFHDHTDRVDAFRGRIVVR